MEAEATGSVVYWFGPHGFLRLLFYSLGVGTTHSKLGSSTWIINQENVPQACLLASNGAGIILTKVLSSRMSLASVKLTS